MPAEQVPNYEAEFLYILLTSFDLKEQEELITLVANEDFTDKVFLTFYKAAVHLIHSGIVADIVSIMEYVRSFKPSKRMFCSFAKRLSRLTLPWEHSMKKEAVIEGLRVEQLKRLYSNAGGD